MQGRSMPRSNRNRKPLTDKEFSILLQNILDQQVTIQPITRDKKREKIQFHRYAGHIGAYSDTHRDTKIRTNNSSESVAVYYIRVIPIASSSRRIVALTKQQYDKCLHVYNAVIQRPPQKPKPISGGSSSEGNKEGGNKE